VAGAAAAFLKVLLVIFLGPVEGCETVQFGDVAALAVFIGNVRLLDNMIIA